MLTCMEDNEARLSGIVSSEPELSHEVHGERFYKFAVKSRRLSENEDILIVTAPESLLGDSEIHKGDAVEVLGQFRSYNNYSGVGNKLVLTLFAKTLYKCDELSESYNEVFLNGYVCKEIICRVTPFGREIADILLAVNRAYNKSDYIPCIAWGRNARRLKDIPVGTNLKICGRMQSRQYEKKINECETEKKTAFEVSVSKVEIAE
ncbi:MAG: single-stranded DNA-binding protein [Ruminococcaceae bacterium]|nr:single-stranded DNA-binding protein [Oscillospiraceae bacterium]